MQNIKWFEITRKYGNIPYKKGSWDINDGLDEFSLMILFLGELGYDILKYKSEWISSKSQILDFIRTRFEKTLSLKKGCICIMDGLEVDSNYVAIYLGRNLFLITHKEIGCRVVKISVDSIKETYK